MESEDSRFLQGYFYITAMVSATKWWRLRQREYSNCNVLNHTIGRWSAAMMAAEYFQKSTFRERSLAFESTWV
jgi:hypothetical protein